MRKTKQQKKDELMTLSGAAIILLMLGTALYLAIA